MKKDPGFTHINSCQLCLSNNRRTIDIRYTKLQLLFEKMINSKVYDETHLCFICHRRLQQCHEFVTLIKETQHIREHFIKHGVMPDHKPPKPLVQLSVCSVINFGIPFEATDAVETVIKDDPDEPKIKDEPQSDIDLETNGIEDSGDEEGDASEEEPSDKNSESEDDIPLTTVQRKRGSGNSKNNVKTKIANKKIKIKQ